MPRMYLLLLMVTSASATGSVVQFVAYAPQQTDITHLFPGAQVEFTWNNVFIVTIWTNSPEALVTEINATLNLNPNIQLLVPPFPLESASRKWLEYNLVWISLLVLVFLAGCTCGGLAISKLASVRTATRAYKTLPAHS